MFKLDLENAEDLWIKLPTSVGTEIKQENSRKTSASSSFTAQKPLTVWITTNCRKFLEKGKQDYLLRREYFLTCLLRNLYAGQEATYMPLSILPLSLLSPSSSPSSPPSSFSFFPPSSSFFQETCIYTS